MRPIDTRRQAGIVTDHSAPPAATPAVLLSRSGTMVVLVAWTGVHGSTRGIAEHIGRRLRRRGVDTRVQPAGTTETLEGVEAVVLGSAVHGGRWLDDATELVHRLGPDLRAMPVWLFSVCSLGDRSSFFGPRVSAFLRRQRATHPDPSMQAIEALVEPLGHHRFAGTIRPGHWGRTGDLVLRALGGSFGDHRDWDEIDAYADAVADRLTRTTTAR